MMRVRKKTVLVFGAFDLLHKGHVHFLNEAKKFGDVLVVAMASDAVIFKLKGCRPHNGFSERRKNLLRLQIADKVVSGDARLGSWKILRKIKPGIIALGYDQKELEKELFAFLQKTGAETRCVLVGACKGRKLHSSILRRTMV